MKILATSSATILATLLACADAALADAPAPPAPEEAATDLGPGPMETSSELVPPDEEPAPAFAVPVGAIDTEFVSATGMPWEVLVDQQPACVTPCQLFFDRPHWITMRTRERRPIRLEVGQVGHAPTAITAYDLQQGKYATGITFTALGGMAALTGVTLTAVGCSTDRSGMCTAGLITGGAGAVVTLGGIWLMRKALPHVQLQRLTQSKVQLYPVGAGAGVSGRF